MRVLPFRPDTDGLLRWLGPLETEIMCACWESDGALTVRDVLTYVPGRAYSTIGTTMRVLAEKGLLAIEHRDIPGSPCPVKYFRPTCTEDDFITFQIDAIQKSLDGVYAEDM